MNATATQQNSDPKTISLTDVEALEEAADGSYLSAEDKANWAKAGHAFYITDVAFYADGEFGAKWTYTVEDDKCSRILSLGDNARRKRTSEAMMKALKDGGRLGPIYLVNEPMRNGKSTWLFSGQAPATKAQAIDPSDIPF